jgi:hypothetical protein
MLNLLTGYYRVGYLALADLGLPLAFRDNQTVVDAGNGGPSETLSAQNRSKRPETPF